MKTYTTIAKLSKRLKANTGRPVECWDDDGIKLRGKVYKMVEYGNMGYNFTGNEYVRFYNKRNDDTIQVEYKLTGEGRTKNIFNFIELVNY